eukprot:10282-Prorocentrum_minimum.AAC.1
MSEVYNPRNPMYPTSSHLESKGALILRKRFERDCSLSQKSKSFLSHGHEQHLRQEGRQEGRGSPEEPGLMSLKTLSKLSEGSNERDKSPSGSQNSSFRKVTKYVPRN